MTTVTSLTADRMLAIEAASVVDGDVVGDNLILTKHDGSQINAGNVRGAPGPSGPQGALLPVISGVPVLDVGLANQIRAGRQLTAADFTNMGLSAPLGLWNLSDLSDVSGNGRVLNNKGGVGFGIGINGSANTAAQLMGLPTQSLYIPDTGSNDPLRIKTATIGCWTKSTPKGVEQILMGKWTNAGNQRGWMLEVGTNNAPALVWSFDGVGAGVLGGLTNVCDDRWHFVVGIFDGTYGKLYVDAILDSTIVIAGVPFPSSSVFNISTATADAGTNGGSPHFGRIDEAFVTADVLSDDQVRNLYCVKIPHTLAVTPSRVSLNVHRRRKGATLAVADFPTQPLRLYNFSGGSLGDEGSNGTVLSMDVGTVSVSGVDGSAGNAFSFKGVQSLYSTDAGLPAGTAPRSYGCWFKTSSQGLGALISWGTYSGNVSFMTVLNNPAGIIDSSSGPDMIQGPFVADGQWHQAITVEDNGAVDGIRRKLYVDGRLVGISSAVASVTLAGAARFRVGTLPDGTWPITGQIDSAFVCDYPLTAEQIWKLYAKSLMALASSPKNPGDHIEAMSANSLLATFDTLESQHTIDLGVEP